MIVRSQLGGIRRTHGSQSMPSATGITPTTTEPSVGVTGWLNHFFPYAGYVLAAWAFISITVLINFASIDD
jgi:hypothetical protein